MGRAKKSKKSKKQQPLIILSAHLELCPDCGESGCVVFASGRRTVEFFSRKVAFELFDMLLKKKHLSSEEVKYLRSEIDKSIVPDVEPELDEFFSPECLFYDDELSDEEAMPQQHWVN